jgi:hypothetical protein
VDKQIQIKELWHLVYDLLNGPGRYQGGRFGRSSAHLGVTFDENLLAEINALNSKQGEELTQAVIQLRANINISETMELFAPTDAERIQSALDKIAPAE